MNLTLDDTKHFYQNSLIASYIEGVCVSGNSVPVTRPSYLFNFNVHSKCHRKLVTSACSLFGDSYFISLFNKFRNFVGMVRHSPKKLKVFKYLFCYLLDCYSKQKVCVISRSSSSYDGRVAASVADFFESEGLAHNIVGYSYNDENGIASSVIPTQLFIDECTRHNVTYSLEKNVPFIEVRDELKKPKDIDLIKKEAPTAFSNAAKPARVYNKLWLNHTASFLNGFELNPFAKRIFNNDLYHGGRFYCHFQNLPSKERANLLIDNEKTVELDFKAMHINILYSLANKSLKSDPYSVDGIDRKVMKLLMLRLVNTNNLAGFKTVVTLSGNPKNKMRYDEYRRDLMQYELGKISIKPAHPFAFGNFIPGVTDHLTGDEALKIITKKHKAIRHMFGTDRLGTKLQNIDSNVMAEILVNLSQKDIPALPVHDSVIVRESDQAIAHDVMKKAYLKIMKHDIDVTRK